MTRIYYDISDKVSTPIQAYSHSVDIPPVKLFCRVRGNVCDYIPRPKKIVQKWWPTVTLIYRGVSYERKITPLKPYQKPRVINWRWNYDNFLGCN